MKFATRSRGFTLLEVVIVVAIVAILMSIAVYTLNRSKERIDLDRSAADLKSRVERVRALASVAGSRLGTQNRIQWDASCGAMAGDQLYIMMNPGAAGSVILPAALTYNQGTDQLTIQCETWNVATETRSIGQLVSPAATFAFSATGRVIYLTPPTDLFVRIENLAVPSEGFGFRVLNSGIVCNASSQVPSSPATICDEDV